MLLHNNVTAIMQFEGLIKELRFYDLTNKMQYVCHACTIYLDNSYIHSY